jgi:hypothetical protein
VVASVATDSRIDRLEVAVDGLKGEVQNLRTDMNARFAEVNSRFAEVNTRINTLTTLMFISVGTTILTAVSVIATMLVTR